MAEYRVWDAVIGHIYHCEHIGSSNRLVNYCFSLTGAKPGAFEIQKIGIHVVAAVVKVFLSALQFFDIVSPELNNVIVDAGRQILAAFQSGDL